MKIVWKGGQERKKLTEKSLETQGVNFINILRTNFLYERHFGSFF
jgi:hypothetical protein